MQLATHKIAVEAPVRLVWTELVRWQDWPAWDGGMERVIFDGPIDTGSIGKLKLKNGPEVLLQISSANECVSYSDFFELIGTRIIFHHQLRELSPERTAVYFSVEARGFSAFIVGNLIRSKIRKGMPGWMEAFRTRCERAALKPALRLSVDATDSRAIT